MTKGYATIVLHNHLPYVIGHGQWPHGMDWLNEAAAETYVPMLERLRRLRADGIAAGLTVGITPVLTEQLADERFKSGFDAYLEMKVEAAVENAAAFAHIGEDHYQKLAERWREYYEGIRRTFNDNLRRDIVGAFRELQDEGLVEIITCAATHGYLPLLGNDECVRAQVKTGIDSYRRHYGRDPKGMWLPECAYRPRYKWRPPTEPDAAPVMRAGLEEILYDAGIKYFVVDAHLLQGGEAIGVYLERFEALQQLWRQFEKGYKPRELDVTKTPYGIYYVSSTGGAKPVAVLTRDPRTTIQVWSGEHGYPGNGYYLDFHKKHFPGGHRFWRVTSAKSDLADKEVYEPGVIEGIIQEQSGHFIDLASELLSDHLARTGKPGVVCSPYDGELFGHWWFEGPRWLEAVVRRFSASPDVELVPGSKALELLEPTHVINIPEGSWGEGGFHYIWLNDWTVWTWRHVYEAERAMVGLVKRLGDRDGRAREILEQMARELLLLESSDWQFLISTWSARDYAEARVTRHFSNFKRLQVMAERALEGGVLSIADDNFLSECRVTNDIFEINLEYWAG